MEIRTGRGKMIGEIVLSLIAFLFLSALAVLIAGILCNGNLLQNPSAMIAQTAASNLGNSVAAIIMIVLFALWYRWYVWRGSVTSAELGVDTNAGNAIIKCIGGFFLGGAVICVEMVLLIGMRQVHFMYHPFTSEIAVNLACALLQQFAVAFSEELTFRGFIQTIAGRRYRWRGMIVSTILFAVMHFINPNYSFLSLANLLLAGLILALMRINSKTLWLPVGFHLANNWVELYVWGFRADGVNAWLSTGLEQNTVWNGGNSGSGGIYLLLLALVLVFELVQYQRSVSTMNKPHSNKRAA